MVVAASHGWTLQRLINEAQTNLKLARQHKQVAPANGALAYIGRVTGLVTDEPVVDRPHVTKILIVAAPGRGEVAVEVQEGSGGRVVEAAGGPPSPPPDNPITTPPLIKLSPPLDEFV